MTNQLDPRVNQWYRHTDKGQQFYVTAIDEENDSIEVQHFDGDIEEYSFPEWRDLNIDLSEEPENWSGSVDIGDPEDFGTQITDTAASDWDEALEEIHSPEREEYVNTESDDNGEGYMEEETIGDANEIVTQESGSSGLIEQGNGVFREMLNGSWYVEYSENPDTGLWQADVFKNDVAEWKNMDFESLEEARQAVVEFYTQL